LPLTTNGPYGPTLSECAVFKDPQIESQEKIAMLDACHRHLTDFFANYLPFTPTSRDIELFETDLRLVSPFIMKAALKEVASGTALRYRPISEWRKAIFKVYNRKVSEHAQLFPVFHSFETAFRSTVAVELEAFYQQSDWWMPVKKEMILSESSREEIQIHGRHIPRETVSLIKKLIGDIEYKDKIDVSTIADGYELLQLCSLNHIRELVIDHWSLFAARFIRRQQMSQKDFSAKFYRIMNARNDIYHHKSVAHLSNVVSTAEELLDSLNFSLRFATLEFATSTPKALQFKNPVLKRHNTW
jgi:hypothetical protein